MRSFRLLCMSLLTLGSCFVFSPLSAQDETPSAPSNLDQPVPGEPELPEEFRTPAPEYNFTTEFTNMMSTLGLILVALLIMAYFVKRMKTVRTEQLNESSTIKILDQRTITPKGILYLVEVMGQLMVLSESPAGIQHVATLSGGSKDSPSFQEYMDRDTGN